MLSNKRITAFITILLISILSCADPGNLNTNTSAAEEEAVEEPENQDTVLTQLDNGEVTVDGVLSVTDKKDTIGPILSIWVTNPGTGEVITTIPCGLVFQPVNPEEQPLMVIQEASAPVAPGGTEVIPLYVVCIDTDTHAPEDASSYTLGTMASGDLLKMAQCVCQQRLSMDEEIENMDTLGIQFAVWTVSEGSDLSAWNTEGAFYDLLSSGETDEEIDAELSTYLEEFKTLMQPLSDRWLEQCGVQMDQ